MIRWRWRRKPNTENWYRNSLHNLLMSIDPSEGRNNRTMSKLEQLIQILAQKADE